MRRRRAICYGDGWYPKAAEAGRDPKSLPEDLARLQLFRDLGAAPVNVRLPAEGREQVLPILDRWARFIRKLNS